MQVVDWSVIAGLTGGAEYNDFLKWAEPLNNYHPEVMDTVPSEVPKNSHLTMKEFAVQIPAYCTQ